MVKKCIVCDAEAEYRIKDSSDYYCQDCAQENFSDLNLLVKLELEAQQLKHLLKEKIAEKTEEAEEEEEKGKE